MDNYENMNLLELYQQSIGGNNRDATKALQKRVGSTPDGIYGANTEAAYAAKSGDYTKLPNYSGEVPTPDQQSAVAAGAASTSSAWIPAAIGAAGGVLSSVTGKSDPVISPVSGNANLGELMKFYQGASDVSHKAPSQRGGFYR